MHEIKENLNQSNSVLKQMANDSSKINNGTNEIGDRAGLMKARARELAQRAGKLKTMINQFKI